MTACGAGLQYFTTSLQGWRSLAMSQNKTKGELKVIAPNASQLLPLIDVQTTKIRRESIYLATPILIGRIRRCQGRGRSKITYSKHVIAFYHLTDAAKPIWNKDLLDLRKMNGACPTPLTVDGAKRGETEAAAWKSLGCQQVLSGPAY